MRGRSASQPRHRAKRGLRCSRLHSWHVHGPLGGLDLAAPEPDERPDGAWVAGILPGLKGEGHCSALWPRPPQRSHVSLTFARFRGAVAAVPGRRYGRAERTRQYGRAVVFVVTIAVARQYGRAWQYGETLLTLLSESKLTSRHLNKKRKRNK